ncbi:MAG TPA: hypothetical protein VIF83_03445 [Gemmatimonadaceae bacterium]
MPYRIVPVGDKLVLMMEPELRRQEMHETAYIRAHDADSGYYDFGAARADANESFIGITSIGGDSHE